MISKGRLFADDTSLGYSSSDPGQIETVLNSDLNELHKWSNDWLTSLNPQKTEVLWISNLYPDFKPSLYFDHDILNVVESHNHLGIFLSSNCKWSIHIDHILSVVAKKVSCFRKLKYKLNTCILNTFYKSYILPLMEYASEVWAGCTITDSDRLEKVQLAAARVVTGLPMYCPTRILYRETGWETLAVRRERKRLCLMYKVVNNIAPSYLTELLPNYVHEMNPYNLRNRNDLVRPPVRLSVFESSFFPKSTSLWNNLN